MLTKVEIQNFQSHKHTEMEFFPGTNVIIGKSDAGKSAVFRAINWVISNRPLGDSYRSEWGGDTRVVLHTSEGSTISRTRSATKNEYSINGLPLKAFGSEVPEDVSAVLRMDAANIQAQMDIPFLLAASPGEAARMLNRAASLDDIDHTISGLRKTHAATKEEIRRGEEALEDLEIQLQKYENLPDIEAKITQAETMEEERASLFTQTQTLKNISQRVMYVEVDLARTAHIDGLVVKCQEAETLHNSYLKTLQELVQLQALVAGVRKRQAHLEATEGMEKALRIVEPAEQCLSDIKELRRHLTGLKNLVRDTTSLDASLKAADAKLDKLEKEYHRISPETCPLCGNKMEGGKKK